MKRALRPLTARTPAARAMLADEYVFEAIRTGAGVRDRAQLVVIAYETGLVRPGLS